MSTDNFDVTAALAVAKAQREAAGLSNEPAETKRDGIPLVAINNRDDRAKYPCHGKREPCTSSWTYDDWHCTGCHWKGLGVQDVAHGDAELKAQYDALKAELGCAE